MFYDKCVLLLFRRDQYSCPCRRTYRQPYSCNSLRLCLPLYYERQRLSEPRRLVLLRLLPRTYRHHHLRNTSRPFQTAFPERQSLRQPIRSANAAIRSASDGTARSANAALRPASNGSADDESAATGYPLQLLRYDKRARHRLLSAVRQQIAVTNTYHNRLSLTGACFFVTSCKKCLTFTANVL